MTAGRERLCALLRAGRPLSVAAGLAMAAAAASAATAPLASAGPARITDDARPGPTSRPRARAESTVRAAGWPPGPVAASPFARLCGGSLAHRRRKS